MFTKTVSRDSLQPGDHITVRYGGRIYYHHGIYVGKAKVRNPFNNGEEHEIDDAVIHFSANGKKTINGPQCRRCFYTPQMTEVMISCLDCFAEDVPISVHAHPNPYPPDKVIETAFSFLEKKRDFGKYNAVFNNCEDFAKFCKTGLSGSSQIALASTALGLPGLVGYGIVKGFWDLVAHRKRK